MHSPRDPEPPPARTGAMVDPRTWIGFLGTAGACFTAGQLGIMFSSEQGFFSPFWPLSGVALGCLLLGGPWMAVGVYGGVAVHNALAGMPALTTWVGPLGLAGEALVAYGLLSRFLGPRPQLTDLRSVFAFLFIAPWLPVLLNGLFGFGLLFADQAAVMDHFAGEFGIFVMANGSALALLAPAFAVWTTAPEAAWWRRGAVIGPVCLATAGFIFLGTSALPAELMLLPLLGAAVVLGLRGVAPLLALVTVIGMLSVWLDRGPFAGRGDFPAEYVQLYIFLGIAACCALPVAAIVGQFRRRLDRASAGARSAGLSVWWWDRAGGVHFDRGENRCWWPVEGTGRLAPETLFDAAIDRGTRETEVDRQPVLSFWQVLRREPSGEPAEAAGILLDLSERLSLERARRQAWQSEVELRNLRASLAPHLLFNCLAAVRGIVRTDPERARAFIDHLARFLRDSTNAQARETVPLLDEWQLCEDFLALQAMRFERDLPRLVEIQGSAYHTRLPPMILLNLVENAVKHGQVDQRHPLVVSARLEDGRLEATVSNRGKLGPQPVSRPGGLGMARARLHAVYGDDAALTVAQGGKEVVATLRIPAAPPGQTPA
jgi:signal transduction histidine kinase